MSEMPNVRTQVFEKEEVVATWVDRLGLICTIGACAIMLLVLAGDLAILLDRYTPSSWQFAGLRAGPILAGVLGFIGGWTTIYHWLRTIARMIFLNEEPNYKKETAGFIGDQASNLPGQADAALRRRRAGCRAQVRAFAAQVSAAVFIAAVLVAGATLWPLQLLAHAGPATASTTLPRAALPTALPTATATPSGPHGYNLVTLPAGIGIPHDAASAPDGTTWFTGMGQLAHVAPDGSVTPISYPSNFGNGNTWEPSHGVVGPDSNFWFTVTTVYNKLPNAVVRVTPSGTFTDFSLTHLNTGVSGIAAGPDGNLWVTEYGNDNNTFVSVQDGAIARMTPAGKVTEFSLPVPSDDYIHPLSITAGPDANLWFTAWTQNFTLSNRNNYRAANEIGRITPAGKVTLFPLTGTSDSVGDITAGADGNLWFTETSLTVQQGTDYIGSITPAGVISLYPTSSAGSGEGGYLHASIVQGSDGSVWTIDAATLISVSSAGVITPYRDFTTVGSDRRVASGANGLIWVVFGDGYESYITNMDENNQPQQVFSFQT